MFLALIAVSCSSPESTDIAIEDSVGQTTGDSAQGNVPGPVDTTSEQAGTSSAAVIPTVVAVATTEPVIAPTPRAQPTPVVIPEPTPAFGPTGRPSDAVESYILEATETIGRPIVYDKPNGQEVPVEYHYLSGSVDRQYDWFQNPTFFGNALTLRVLQGKPGAEWAKVQIPTRPITEAWIPTEHWEWNSTNHYVEVNISNNTLTVWDGDVRIVDAVSVVTGSNGRATPVASTFVDEKMPGPSGAYGPWLLSLGVFSDELNTFGSAGALPKTAIHGTNQPHLLGQYASNGCIRIPNDVITELAEILPVGTRVDIVDREPVEIAEPETDKDKDGTDADKASDVTAGDKASDVTAGDKATSDSDDSNKSD